MTLLDTGILNEVLKQKNVVVLRHASACPRKHVQFGSAGRRTLESLTGREPGFAIDCRPDPKPASTTARRDGKHGNGQAAVSRLRRSTRLGVRIGGTAAGGQVRHAVLGMIFFGEARLDPQTKPWTSHVRSIVLVEELRRLAKRAPEHPLVAVFQPLLAGRETDLEHTAGGFYRTIKNSKLKKDVKEVLEEVFVSWLLQRLPDRSKTEIEKMLIGELPELVDTRAGQDILKIGEQRGLKIGEERGLVEAAVILLEAKRGRLTKSLRQRLQTLAAKQLRQLLADAIPWESLDLLDAWLAAHGK